MPFGLGGFPIPVVEGEVATGARGVPAVVPADPAGAEGLVAVVEAFELAVLLLFVLDGDDDVLFFAATTTPTATAPIRKPPTEPPVMAPVFVAELEESSKRGQIPFGVHVVQNLPVYPTTQLQ